MMLHSSYQRLTESFSFRENRLCAFSEAGPENAKTSEQEGFIIALKTHVSWIDAPEKVHLVALTNEIPSRLLNELKTKWSADNPEKKEVENFLSRASELFEDMPLLKKKFNELPPGPCDYRALNRLIDHEEWLKAWDSVDFTIPEKKAGGIIVDRDYGPQQFLEGLSAPQRTTLYHEYVQKYIPKKAGEWFIGDKAPAGKTDKDLVNNSLRLILGVDGAADIPGAKIIAAESLNDYYEASTLRTAAPWKFSQQIRQEIDPSNGSVDVKIQELKDEKKFSRMNGALNMPEVSVTWLAGIKQDLEKVQQSRDVAQAKTHQDLDHLVGATKAEQVREAKTWGQTWDNMEGWEKLLLIGLAGYAAWKLPTAAGLLAATYLGIKFMGNDDPLGSISSRVNQGMSFLGRVSPEWMTANSMLPASRVLAQKAEVVMDKVPYTEEKAMEASATGLALLLDLPMVNLAKYYAPPGQGQNSNGTFQWSTGPGGAKSELRTLAKARGWKFDEEFFNKRENLEMLSKTLKHVFFLYYFNHALPGHETEFEKVEMAREEAGSYAAISGPAESVYNRLSTAGHALALKQEEGGNAATGGKLSDFLNKVKLPTSSESLSRRYAKRMETSQNFYNKQGFYIEHKGDIVTISKKADEFYIWHRYSPFDMGISTFLSLTDDAALEKWKNHIFNQKKAELEKGSLPDNKDLPGMNIKKFHLERNGDIVSYKIYNDLAEKNIAKSPLINFLKTDNQVIYDKFQTWLGQRQPRDTDDPLK